MPSSHCMIFKVVGSPLFSHCTTRWGSIQLLLCSHCTMNRRLHTAWLYNRKNRRQLYLVSTIKMVAHKKFAIHMFCVQRKGEKEKKKIMEEMVIVMLWSITPPRTSHCPVSCSLIGCLACQICLWFRAFVGDFAKPLGELKSGLQSCSFNLGVSGTWADRLFLFTSYRNKHEWTSEGILFQLRKDVNTQFFKFNSTDVNLLSCLVCLSDKILRYDWSDHLSIKLPVKGELHTYSTHLTEDNGITLKVNVYLQARLRINY